MGTSNSFGTYVAGTPSIKLLPTLFLECEKIKSLPINQKFLLRLKVSGKNGWFADKYSLELVPSSNKIKISNTSFEIEEEWVIKTYIECSEVLNGYLQVKIDGKDSNRININFTSNEAKDVFSTTEITRLINENIYLAVQVNKTSPLVEYRGNYCMSAAERGVSELLKDYNNFYSVERTTDKRRNSVSFTGKTAIDRGNAFDGLGFVKNNWKFDKYKINHSDRETINNSKNYQEANSNYNIVDQTIITLSDESKKEMYELFLNDITSIGYHVYYFTITGGFHTLLLVIDATKSPCESTYKMYDQHGEKSKGQGSLKDIGEGFRAQTSHNFSNSCLNRYSEGKTKYWDKTFTQVWKIQKK
jgi:hypothetical protein